MKETYVRFMAPVLPKTIDHLMRIVDQKLHQKYERFHLLLSSPGGSVFHGLSVYNFLKGAPIQVYTYNFGSVDSIGVVMYCAGSKRFCVPHARFLIHGVKMNFSGQASFDEFQIHEHLKGVQIDQKNIARVIADNTGKSSDVIEKDMHDRKTLNPTEAKDYGLVHEIRSELFPIDAEFVSIGEPIHQTPVQIMPQVPQAGNFTKSVDIDIVTI
ncbi:MAG: ATP-dependent Clp protease proteolytic subunit [Planctomycetes bacterium]|nr:ATP-dependent Clp protease proteolytic subunit [Planctomycetota bacterium]MBU1518102.1 ATP-dependent Clp protease proteolytic subunit [Planctomycetota bacterium]MBU2458658.1 ATP-dependent Clp protease proteolytic subunit [Planctomycetota bacterium]MBU2597350.1 ATP-dependent Clp protease proteolytic subunit [Planctomycetota bacterium]